MTAELMTDEPHFNLVARSGAMNRNNKVDGKKEVAATCVRKTNEKSPMFDIQKEKQVFMEVKQRFMDVGASTSSCSSIRRIVVVCHLDTIPIPNNTRTRCNI